VRCAGWPTPESGRPLRSDFALRYCALHQLQIHQTYSDDGVSGTVPVESRPLGRHLLEDAQLHKFDQLLIFKLDRLGRDTRLILNTVDELEKHGVRVRSMTEEFDTATSTGRLMLTFLSGFAAHERELIRERSMAGSNRLAEDCSATEPRLPDCRSSRRSPPLPRAHRRSAAASPTRRFAGIYFSEQFVRAENCTRQSATAYLLGFREPRAVAPRIS
jgi:DNA invertase Pin-like site-specific DNA recombinase